MIGEKYSRISSRMNCFQLCAGWRLASVLTPSIAPVMGARSKRSATATNFLICIQFPLRVGAIDPTCLLIVILRIGNSFASPKIFTLWPWRWDQACTCRNQRTFAMEASRRAASYCHVGIALDSDVSTVTSVLEIYKAISLHFKTLGFLLMIWKASIVFCDIFYTSHLRHAANDGIS